MSLGASRRVYGMDSWRCSGLLHPSYKTEGTGCISYFSSPCPEISRNTFGYHRDMNCSLISLKGVIQGIRDYYRGY